jgi:prepilin-type N-terminal cleavage/methylation domain-containing protein
MRRVLAQGFTLVELLIVIALLGVIATIVIAAINPIEQAKRAADAGQKANGSQLVSAYQRYFVSNNEYPWNKVDPTTYKSADAAFGFVDVQSADAGLCDPSSGCGTPGEIITSGELQTAFLSRSFINTTDVTKKLFVGLGAASSTTQAQPTVYVCWIPQSSSSRTTLATATKIVDLQSGFTNGLPAYSATCADWTAVDGNGIPACGECVPE